MIGVFDSGLGGLTIFRSLVTILPQYSFIYLGDTARLPYGNRSPEAIYRFTCEGVDFLFRKNCKLVILACNTATAYALPKIQKQWLPSRHAGKKVLGVIRPLAEAAVRESKNKRIGVIGTRGTIESCAYIREVSGQDPHVIVYQQATPLLVPLIEEGWNRRTETKRILRFYLRPLKVKKIDTLILGCTHYPLILSAVQGVMGKSCRVLDSGDIVAVSLKDYLSRHPDVENPLARKGERIFYVTDLTQNFQRIASNWLKERVHLIPVTLP